MARLELDADRLADPATWPDVCARCGAGGTTPVPVPEKQTADAGPFALPLCPAHQDDWGTVARRAQVAAAVFLTGVAVAVGVGLAAFGGRVEAVVFAALATAFVLGGGLAVWAGSPIRVNHRTGRLVAIIGVCRAFAEAVPKSLPSALPAVAEAGRFEVTPYRPARHCPADVAAKGVALVALVGVAFGGAVGLANWGMNEVAGGWARNDWRFPALAAGAVAALGVAVVGVRSLAYRGCLVALAVFAGVAVGLVVLIGLAGAGFRTGFAAVLALVPLVLLYVLAVHPVVNTWRVRSGLVAGLLGAAGPAGFAAGVVAVLGPGGPGAAPACAVAVIALVCFPTMARGEARAPYCAACDGWLTPRRIGSLPRPRADVEPALAGGQVIALTGVPASAAQPEIGAVDLTCHSCPGCREAGTVVLELKDCVGEGKNGKIATLVRVDQWLYPGPALLVVEQMFPPPAEPAPPANAPPRTDGG